MLSIIHELGFIKGLYNKAVAAGQKSVDNKLAAGGAEAAKEGLNKAAGTGFIARIAKKKASALANAMQDN